MTSIYELKPKFQALLRPLTTQLAAKGVTANQVTVLAAALSVMTGGLLLVTREPSALLLLVPLILFLRMALNAIDGMLAREFGMKSNLGAILNELGDVISDAALYLPLATISPISPWLVVPLVVLAVISEMTGVLSIQIGGVRRYDGPMGKSDRAFVFGLICLLLGLGVAAGWWVNALLFATLVLLVATIWNRARKALLELG